METFFLSKKNTFFILFSKFFNFQNFLIFFPKNLIITAGKTFLRNNTIWYAFYSKFAIFIDFEKILFFFKNRLFYQRTQIWNVLRKGILQLQSQSTATLLQFSEKNFHFQWREHTADVRMLA